MEKNIDAHTSIVIPGEREIIRAREGDPGIEYRPVFDTWIPFPSLPTGRSAGNDKFGNVLTGGISQ
jgi:hypothetical protein